MSRFRRENGICVPRSVFDSLRIRDDVAEQFRQIAKARSMTHTQLLAALMGTFNEIAGFYDGGTNNKAVSPFLRQLERLLGDFNDGNGDGGFGGIL